jgi:5-oxopent-3-ene-1,2,5-tricarboxylate decarboxylase/2-hydroxyhepta-2,4-diene-1,7-dioate isomerase
MNADDAALLERLREVPTANAKQILRALGVARTVIAGVSRMTTERRIAGRARTLRFLPAREDATPPSKGLNRALIDSLAPGDVLVIDAGGCADGAVLGDMMAARAHACGAAGVVADGVIRDVEGIGEIGLPVWARGSYPDSNVVSLIAWDTDVAIRCGGALVQPGDYILADADAALVVPAALAGETIRRANTMALEDEFSQNLLRDGVALDDAYPIPPARRAAFDEFARTRRA